MTLAQRLPALPLLAQQSNLQNTLQYLKVVFCVRYARSTVALSTAILPMIHIDLSFKWSMMCRIKWTLPEPEAAEEAQKLTQQLLDQGKLLSQPSIAIQQQQLRPEMKQ